MDPTATLTLFLTGFVAGAGLIWIEAQQYVPGGFVTILKGAKARYFDRKKKPTSTPHPTTHTPKTPTHPRQESWPGPFYRGKT